MTKFIAFLRGINVGGNRSVKMEELKKTFESSGFKNVKTVLASGNVIFETKQSNTTAISKKIEDDLKMDFGIEINVMIRSIEELKSLADADPFKGIDVTPETRLYVTFTSEKFKSKLKIPYETPDKNFKILRVTDNDVCSVLTLTPENKTVELMGIIEKEFGKKVTTRNWNTILRFLKNEK
ncbi:MAG: DUF1697 domain-containing protein [Bacteroidota bacterium]|nr:DUF1697 domain-containing protein [Bacteroidota bacterium]